MTASGKGIVFLPRVNDLSGSSRLPALRGHGQGSPRVLGAAGLAMSQCSVSRSADGLRSRGSPGHQASAGQATGDAFARRSVNSAWNAALWPSGTPAAMPGTSPHPRLFGDMTSSLPVVSPSTSSQAHAQVSPTFVTPPNSSSGLARSAYPEPLHPHPPTTSPHSSGAQKTPAPRPRLSISPLHTCVLTQGRAGALPYASASASAFTSASASEAPQNPRPFSSGSNPTLRACTNGHRTRGLTRNPHSPTWSTSPGTALPRPHLIGHLLILPRRSLLLPAPLMRALPYLSTPNRPASPSRVRALQPLPQEAPCGQIQWLPAGQDSHGKAISNRPPLLTPGFPPTPQPDAPALHI